MDATKSKVWHDWQSVIRDAGKLDHNSSEAYELLGREMALEMHNAAVYASQQAAANQSSAMTVIDALNDEAGEALAAFFCDGDPRTPAQIEADILDAETRATHESARPF